MIWWILVIGILAAIFSILGFGAYGVSAALAGTVFKSLAAGFLFAFVVLVITRIVHSIE